MDMKKNKNCLVLIGMPGAGKSTVGVVLAKKLCLRFQDSDLLIQDRLGKPLYQLIEEQGIDGFWKIEEKINMEIDTRNTIVATGGSAVYGAGAMEYFKKRGILVYLQLKYPDLKKRLGDLTHRGVTMRPGQTLKELYEERVPLYEGFADITISCDGKEIREIVEDIINAVKEF